MRLIDADSLVVNGWMLARFYDGNKLVKTKKISEVPTVDAVPVVRCKDCRHSYDDIGGLVCSYGTCVDCIVQDYFYCSYGERKNENGK